MNETNLHYLAYDEVGITIAVIAIALAFIVLVWNAVKAIHDWRLMARKPTSDILANHEQRITHLEDCCDDVNQKLKSDWEFRNDEREINQLVLRSIKQLLQHAVDGNNTEKLESMEHEIDEYLYRKIQNGS